MKFKLVFLVLCAVFLFVFLNRGSTEAADSSKILCLMFVYVLSRINLCRDWFCGFE